MKIIDCGITEFVAGCQMKKVVCFGAGKQLQEFVNTLPEIEIYKVIDNYNYGYNMKINGRELSVISFIEFLDLYECIKNDIVLVITCMSFVDVIRQLECIEQIHSLRCYIYLFVREYTEETTMAQISQKELLIPKQIHYCWFGEKAIPDTYKQNIESWHKFCPNYEIIRWDESNYNLNSSGYLKQAYESKRWAFVSDYARVDILNQQGGIYLDTDVEVVRSLDDLLGWKLFCGFENTNWINWGLAIGAVKKHPIVKELLEIYNNTLFKNEDGTCNEITCPVYQTRIMQKYGFIMNNRFQQNDGVAVYPKECFAPFGFFKGMGRRTTNTYSIHWYAASWFDREQQSKRNKIQQDISWVRGRYGL